MYLRNTLLFTLLLTIPLHAQIDAKGRALEFPPGYESNLDVTYVKVGDWEGKMDIYTPPRRATLTPVEIRIHGGGWEQGSKVQPGGIFADMGLAIVNVEYRFRQVSPAPAAIEDTRCALKYVIRHAQELNIDTKRIVLVGTSAGGHLALMTGLLADDRRFDRNCPGNEEMKVAGVVDEYGPSDFTSPSWGSLSKTRSMVSWLGTKSGDESFRKSISPVTYASRDSPPVLIVHGDKDPTVPIEQSQVLNAVLKANASKVEFVVIPGGGHGGFSPEGNRLMNDKIRVFLKLIGVTN